MKTKVCGIVGVLCIMLIIFILRENKEKQQNTGEVFWKDFILDDSTSLEKALTKEYDIQELYVFFGGRMENEGLPFGGGTFEALCIEEVHAKFPVEVPRTTRYSVYKVKQGGYFYVFWAQPINGNTKKVLEPRTYFSVYLTSERDVKDFDAIKPGKSTAADVKEIDPGVEMDFRASYGPWSYSYINADTVLCIKYKEQGEDSKYDNLIVEKIEALPREREAGVARCSVILEKDLPSSQNELIIRGVCVGSALVAVFTFVMVMVRRKKGRLGKNSNFGA